MGKVEIQGDVGFSLNGFGQHWRGVGVSSEASALDDLATKQPERDLIAYIIQDAVIVASRPPVVRTYSTRATRLRDEQYRHLATEAHRWLFQPDDPTEDGTLSFYCSLIDIDANALRQRLTREWTKILHRRMDNPSNRMQPVAKNPDRRPRGRRRRVSKDNTSDRRKPSQPAVMAA